MCAEYVLSQELVPRSKVWEQKSEQKRGPEDFQARDMKPFHPLVAGGSGRNSRGTHQFPTLI